MKIKRLNKRISNKSKLANIFALVTVFFYSAQISASFTVGELENNSSEMVLSRFLELASNQKNDSAGTFAVHANTVDSVSTHSLFLQDEMSIDQFVSAAWMKSSRQLVAVKSNKSETTEFDTELPQSTDEAKNTVRYSLASAPAAYPVSPTPVAPSAKQSVALVPDKNPTRIAVSFGLNGFSVSPSQISLVDDQASEGIAIEGSFKNEQLRIFVRDSEVAKYNSQTRRVDFLKPGKTEIYFVSTNEMKIASIERQDSSANIVSVQPLSKKPSSPEAGTSRAAMVDFGAGIESPANQPNEYASNEEDDDEDEENSSIEVKVQHAAQSGLSVSVEDSAAQIARTLAVDSTNKQSLRIASQELQQAKVTLQIVDERSLPEQGVVYPVVGVAVRLVGADMPLKTDAKGMVTFQSLPLDSHFMVAIEDAGGEYRSSVFDLGASDIASGQVKRLSLSRYDTMGFYAQSVKVVQNASTSSFCLKVVHEEGEVVSPLGGYSLEIDIAAEGPFYFESGLLRAERKTSGADGRACYFNVDPGPFMLRVWKDGEEIAASPINSFAGRHLNETWDIRSKSKFEALTTANVSVKTHFGSNQQQDLLLSPLAETDVVSLGSEKALNVLQNAATVRSENEFAPHGRLFVAAQMDEFETSIQALDDRRYAKVGEKVRANQMVLLPRGFMDDVAAEAGLSRDEQLGSLYLQYIHHADFSEESVNIMVLDENGRKVGTAQFFSDFPATRAAFIDLNPGKYFVSVESKSGRWLAGDTIIVYSETTTMSHLGAPLVYRP